MFTIEIFRTGVHTDSSGVTMHFTAELLQDIASSYASNIWKAPLVLGHPDHDTPAYGWVDSLRVEGELLLASGEEVDPVIVELVNRRAYQNVSAALYAPENSSNPVPGHWYLRHVGLLGATPPAVKGLKTPKFSEGSYLMFGVPKPEANQSKEDGLKAREDALKAREDALKAREQATEAKSFCENLVRQGKLLPVQTAVAEALLMTELPTFRFQEQDVPGNSLVRKLLESMPVIVNYTEVAEQKDTQPNTDAESIALRAREFVQAQGKLGRQISYAEAVEHVRGGK